MAKWPFRVIGEEPVPRAVRPHEAPTVAVDRPKAVAKAEATADHQYQGMIREILRLELEFAADAWLSKGNLAAARILSELAKTTRHVEVRVLYAYAHLLDDIAVPAVSSDERRIGFEWHPKDAAGYIERLVSSGRADRFTLGKADK